MAELSQYQKYTKMSSSRKLRDCANWGYLSDSTIQLDPDASKICTIIFPWGKYSYKRLPMGIAGSPDFFQAKMMELMESLEYVRAYIDDLLCISRNSLEDHLEKLEEVLRQLCDAGLKVNADQSTFCAFEIEYLGYVLTSEVEPKTIFMGHEILSFITQ